MPDHARYSIAIYLGLLLAGAFGWPRETRIALGSPLVPPPPLIDTSMLPEPKLRPLEPLLAPEAGTLKGYEYRFEHQTLADPADRPEPGGDRDPLRRPAAQP